MRAYTYTNSNQVSQDRKLHPYQGRTQHEISLHPSNTNKKTIMAIRDRVRRAFSRCPESSLYSSRSTSTSNFTSSSKSSPEPPSLTLSKSLTRTLTFRSTRSQKSSEEKALEEWAKKDAKEWKRPSVKFPIRKSQHHQDLLRAFEFNSIRPCRDGDSRNSVWSGISPCASRKASFAEPRLERVLSGSGSGSIGGRGNSVRKGAHLSSDGGRRVVAVLEE